MNGIKLRKAAPGDEKTLAYIQTESWKAAFSGILSPEELESSTDIKKAEEMYKKVLDRNNVNIVIEFVGEKPHCIAGWSVNRNGLGQGAAELICIHSLQDNWRRGYGSVMMRHILGEIQEAGYSEVILWVFEKNFSARKFYEKHGFILSDMKNESHGAVEIMYSRKIEMPLQET